jgi:hypothetical protein
MCGLLPIEWNNIYNGDIRDSLHVESSGILLKIDIFLIVKMQSKRIESLFTSNIQCCALLAIYFNLLKVVVIVNLVP